MKNMIALLVIFGILGIFDVTLYGLYGELRDIERRHSDDNANRSRPAQPVPEPVASASLLARHAQPIPEPAAYVNPLARYTQPVPEPAASASLLARHAQPIPEPAAYVSPLARYAQSVPEPAAPANLLASHSQPAVPVDLLTQPVQPILEHIVPANLQARQPLAVRLLQLQRAQRTPVRREVRFEPLQHNDVIDALIMGASAGTIPVAGVPLALWLMKMGHDNNRSRYELAAIFAGMSLSQAYILIIAYFSYELAALILSSTDARVLGALLFLVSLAYATKRVGPQLLEAARARIGARRVRFASAVLNTAVE